MKYTNKEIHAMVEVIQSYIYRDDHDLQIDYYALSGGYYLVWVNKNNGDRVAFSDVAHVGGRMQKKVFGAYLQGIIDGCRITDLIKKKSK